VKSKNFVGVTWLKIASAERLRDMDEPVIICLHSQPLAALVPYDLFMKWQKAIAEAQLCGVVGEPEAGRFVCELPKGHEGYHRSGLVSWLGYQP
jgi:hypothetical protein